MYIDLLCNILIFYFITLHLCITLYCIILYYIILHYTVLHYIILYYAVLYHVMLYYVIVLYFNTAHILLLAYLIEHPFGSSARFTLLLFQ